MKLNWVGVFNDAYHGLDHYSFNSILLIFFQYNFYLFKFFVLGDTVSVSVGQALIAELIIDVVLYYV